MSRGEHEGFPPYKRLTNGLFAGSRQSSPGGRFIGAWPPSRPHGPHNGGATQLSLVAGFGRVNHARRISGKASSGGRSRVGSAGSRVFSASRTGITRKEKAGDTALERGTVPGFCEKKEGPVARGCFTGPSGTSASETNGQAKITLSVANTCTSLGVIPDAGIMVGCRSFFCYYAGDGPRFAERNRVCSHGHPPDERPSPRQAAFLE